MANKNVKAISVTTSNALLKNKVLLSFCLDVTYGLLLLIPILLYVPDSEAYLNAKPGCTELIDLGSDREKSAYQRLFDAIEKNNTVNVEKELKTGLKLNIAEIYDGELGCVMAGPLDWAVIHGNRAMVSLLLENGASPDGCATGVYEPLHWALKKRFQGIFEQLVENGANLNTRSYFKYEEPESGKTPLFALETKHDQETDADKNILFLITHGADINATVDSLPFLYYSMKLGRSRPTVPMLISSGVRIDNILPDGGNILHWMSKRLYDQGKKTHDYWHLVTHYIKAGEHRGIQWAEKDPVFKPLIANVRKSIIENPSRNWMTTNSNILSWLTDLFYRTVHQEEAAPDLPFLLKRISQGFSATQEQTRMQSNHTAPDLCEQCALSDAVDVNLEDNAGNPPLYYAAKFGHQLAISALIDELGADVNRPGEYGLTPLHIAVSEQRTNIIDQLLLAGADPLVKDINGHTAFDMLALSSDQQIEKKMLIASSLCRNQPDGEFQIASFHFECRSFLHDSHLIQHLSVSCLFPNFQQLSTTDRQLCILYSPPEELKSKLPWLLSMEKLLPNERLAVVRKAGEKDTFDLLQTVVASSNIQHIQVLLDAYPIHEVFPINRAEKFHQLLRSSTDDKTLSLLLDWGIDPDSKDFLEREVSKDNLSALLRALMSGDLGKVKVLIEHGASLSQPGLLPAAIYGNNIKALAYILDQGVQERAHIVHTIGCWGDAEPLCHEDYNVWWNTLVDTDMVLMLKLYDRSLFDPKPPENLQDIYQQKQDIALIKAVTSLDREGVATALAAGANPNLRYLCDAESTAIHGVYGPKYKICSGGLLGDAMLRERFDSTAEVSRLLLLYGASVRPAHPPHCMDDEGCAPPLDLIESIQDIELAKVLRYYDGPGRQLSAQRRDSQKRSRELSWELSWEALEADQLLRQTARGAGISLGTSISPVQSCLSLRPAHHESDLIWMDSDSTSPFLNGTLCFDNHCQTAESRFTATGFSEAAPTVVGNAFIHFQPYCQKIYSQLSDDGKQALEYEH